MPKKNMTELVHAVKGTPGESLIPVIRSSIRNRRRLPDASSLVTEADGNVLKLLTDALEDAAFHAAVLATSMAGIENDWGEKEISEATGMPWTD